MRCVQPRPPFARHLPRSATVMCLALALVAACTDRAQQASAAGALAEQQLAAGNLEGAKRSISKAIAAQDDNLDLQLLRGRIAVARGAPEEAYSAYSDALSLDSTNGEALQGVSQFGLSTGHLQESLEATKRILLLAPDQPDALLTRGIHSLIRRRFDEAVEFADKILASNPANENAIILKARAQFLRGDTEQALATVSAAASGKSETAGVALTKLELSRELRRPDDMKAEFAKLRSLRPGDQALRLDEADLHFKLGERAQAQQLVTEVLSDPQAQGETIDKAIQLWVDYGARDAPISGLRRIAASGAAGARRATARFLIEADLLDLAEPVLTSLTGEDRAALAAREEARKGNYAQALASADTVLKRDSTQCDALVANSGANAGLRRWAAALQSGQRAAAECPEQAAAWLATADAYKGLGEASGAERIYSQAFAAHPQDVRVVRSYADWLIEQKRPREALAIARRLTRNAPASLAGWAYYRDLCRRSHQDCQDEASRGFQDAQTRFGTDLPIGSPAPNSLFGRLASR